MQDLFVEDSLVTIIELICLSVFFLIMFTTIQLPSVLTSERVAAMVSFVAVAVFSVALFAIASSSCTVLLFALLLAVHAMLPISRISSFVMSSSLIILYLLLSVVNNKMSLSWRFSGKVS